MTGRGFKLIEPRVTFYRDQLSSFDAPRYSVREAQRDDISVLRDVAGNCANRFDRVHADKFFSKQSADDYLATYVENSVQGFADVVLVPAEAGVPAKAFATGNYMVDEWPKINSRVSRFVLAAVHPECSGWFRKLASEMTYNLREAGAESVLMTTQTANRATIRAMEHLGYRIGTTTHILSYSQPD
jgi:dTDP-4-amino-4,6-dideoxy-D-galactose acyltransferase